MAVTPASFKARFPEFNAVSDTLIQIIIDEQSPQVGETWVAADRDPALQYLVAHILTLEGEPGRTASGGAVSDAGKVKRRKVGDVEVEFFDSSASTVTGGIGAGFYSTTRYGKMFYQYLRRNFTAIAVV